MATFNITERAFSTAQMYAHLADKMECMGFLAGNAESDLIDTVILAPQQRVAAASVSVTPLGILAAGRELERLGKEAKGWWHSHGHLPPFHSATDDANSQELMTQIGYLNQARVAIPFSMEALAPDGRLQFKGHDTHQGELCGLSHELAQQLMTVAPTFWLTQTAMTVYSLVLNAYGDEPYAERLLQHTCPFCQENHTIRERLTLAIIPSAQIEAGDSDTAPIYPDWLADLTTETERPSELTFLSSFTDLYLSQFPWFARVEHQIHRGWQHLLATRRKMGL